MFLPSAPLALDVETDEEDNFAGLALCQSADEVYFYDKDQWCDELADFIGSFNFIMQGGKFDIRMLKKWGVKTGYNRLQYDTKIMAYSMDSTMQKYGLKEMSKKFIGMEWSTYREMVGSGKKKITLDKQDPERVGKYCGTDALATFRLSQYLWAHMNTAQHEYFSTIEMPLYRLLAKMEDHGVYLDTEYLKKLDVDLGKKVNEWEEKLKTYGDFNPRSPKQLLEVFKKYHLPLKSTNSKVLQEYRKKPLVEELLQYRKYKKLKSTYTEPFLNSATLPRIHAQFTQSTITGRLASSKPNLQNIPVRGEEGKKIRSAFSCPDGTKLLCLDYSQIEYRLFAHYTEDSVLLEAFRNGKDVHEETARIIEADRGLGKTINFAAIYGAQAKRIAETAGIDKDRAAELLSRYWERLPKAAAWVSAEKWRAKKNGGVTTICGRFIPLPGLKSSNKFERWHWERVAVNATIQGSAAEIIKKAMLELDASGYPPVLTVHDELMFEFDEDRELKQIEALIVRIMENVMSLKVPLKVEGGWGKTWTEAK